MSRKVVNPQLTVTYEGERRCLNLEDGRTTIGRKSDNTLVIADPSVSGHHAAIVISEDEAVLEDLGSTNGTYINKQRIDMPYRLINGTSIAIGLSRLFFSMNQPLRDGTDNFKDRIEGAARTSVSSRFMETCTSVQASIEYLDEKMNVIRTVDLDKTVNPLGRLGVGVAAISFGRNGWILSPVDGLSPLLNGKPVTTAPALLNNGDVINLGDLYVRFVA